MNGIVRTEARAILLLLYNRLIQRLFYDGHDRLFALNGYGYDTRCRNGDRLVVGSDRLSDYRLTENSRDRDVLTSRAHDRDLTVASDNLYRLNSYLIVSRRVVLDLVVDIEDLGLSDRLVEVVIVRDYGHTILDLHPTTTHRRDRYLAQILVQDSGAILLSLRLDHEAVVLIVDQAEREDHVLVLVVAQSDRVGEHLRILQVGSDQLLGRYVRVQDEQRILRVDSVLERQTSVVLSALSDLALVVIVLRVDRILSVEQVHRTGEALREDRMYGRKPTSRPESRGDERSSRYTRSCRPG